MPIASGRRNLPVFLGISVFYGKADRGRKAFFQYRPEVGEIAKHVGGGYLVKRRMRRRQIGYNVGFDELFIDVFSFGPFEHFGGKVNAGYPVFRSFQAFTQQAGSTAEVEDFALDISETAADFLWQGILDLPEGGIITAGKMVEKLLGICCLLYTSPSPRDA